MHKTILSLLTVVTLSACASPRQGFSPSRDTATAVKPVKLVRADQTLQGWGDKSEPEEADEGSLWQRICSHLALAELENPRIEQHIRQLSGDPYHLYQLSERATPFLHYIFEQTVERKLPAELVFVPMVESAFRTTATSSQEAGGLWQIRPATAEYLGLELNRWYDGRYDIQAATGAALNYLEYLHETFDGDWLLALAAYNAGEGTVRRAIRQNQAAGKPTDFWNLSLPEATLDYVPEILALSRIAADPEAYGVEIRDIEDAPYLAKVDIDRPIELASAAAAIGMSADDIRRLNACYKHGVTPPKKDYGLLLPLKQALLLKEKLASLPAVRRSGEGRNYVVKRGDTLWAIARRHGISYHKLARSNGMRMSEILKPGQQLVIY